MHKGLEIRRINYNQALPGSFHSLCSKNFAAKFWKHCTRKAVCLKSVHILFLRIISLSEEAEGAKDKTITHFVMSTTACSMPSIRATTRSCTDCDKVAASSRCTLGWTVVGEEREAKRRSSNRYKGETKEIKSGQGSRGKPNQMGGRRYKEAV